MGPGVVTRLPCPGGRSATRPGNTETVSEPTSRDGVARPSLSNHCARVDGRRWLAGPRPGLTLGSWGAGGQFQANHVRTLFLEGTEVWNNRWAGSQAGSPARGPPVKGRGDGGRGGGRAGGSRAACPRPTATAWKGAGVACGWRTQAGALEAAPSPGPQRGLLPAWRAESDSQVRTQVP